MNVSVPDEMWDQLYGQPDYMFGLMPNQYFKDKLSEFKPGKILLPGDGEGRNAVYAARNSWQVSAFDLSEFGKEKADAWARENGVEIDFKVGDARNLEYAKGEFDGMALIFAHFPYDLRRSIHQKLAGFIKPGGFVIVQGFSRPAAIHDIRYSLEEMKGDFSDFFWTEAVEKIALLTEGQVINGPSEVVNMVGQKENNPWAKIKAG